MKTLTLVFIIIFAVATCVVEAKKSPELSYSEEDITNAMKHAKTDVRFK